MIRLLVSLALGALAGWIAGKIMKSSATGTAIRKQKKTGLPPIAR